MEITRNSAIRPKFGLSRRALATLPLLAPLMAAMPSIAGEHVPCTCYANGQRIEEGRVFCIRPPSGEAFLARCERVLNNTSWKILQQGCPQESAAAVTAPPAPEATTSG